MQHIGEFRADPSQAHKHCHLCRNLLVVLSWHYLGITNRLYRLDLLNQKFEAIEFTDDLHLEMLRQRSAVSSPQFLQPCPTILTSWLVVKYPLREQ